MFGDPLDQLYPSPPTPPPPPPGHIKVYMGADRTLKFKLTIGRGKEDSYGNERSTSEVAEMARIEIPGLYSWNASGGRYDLTQTAYKTA